jgi:hypothetical protein
MSQLRDVLRRRLHGSLGRRPGSGPRVVPHLGAEDVDVATPEPVFENPYLATRWGRTYDREVLPGLG